MGFEDSKTKGGDLSEAETEVQDYLFPVAIDALDRL